MGVRRGGAKRAFFPPCKLRPKTKNFRKPEFNSQVPINSFNCCNESLSADDTDTPQEPSSLFWCHAIMRLQFAHVRSFAAEASCETC